jgi:DNA-binding beta-propeller fold protein YncE
LKVWQILTQFFLSLIKHDYKVDCPSKTQLGTDGMAQCEFGDSLQGIRLSGFALTFSLVLPLLFGCLSSVDSSDSKVLVYSRKGLDAGRLIKPRAITIDPATDELYIVDMTSRIQVFDCDGNYLRGWRTPECQNGKPVGLSFSREGYLIVSDTHYFRILFYTPKGELLPERTIGGANGRGPGEFGFITDVAEDSRGNLYVGEYGDYDRIQKFSPTGEFLTQWGHHGTEPGGFLRPQCMVVDQSDFLWVADVSNHRIQVFDVSGEEPKLVQHWGEQGAAPGKLSYPNALWIDDELGHVIICDMGNHRLQGFTREGEYLWSFGGPGREPGQMYQPWAFVKDGKGAFHVLDTYNHRVQRFEINIEAQGKRVRRTENE